MVMKLSLPTLLSLVAVTAGGAFAACQSIEPVEADIGVDPATLVDDAGPELDAAVDAGPELDAAVDAAVDAGDTAVDAAVDAGDTAEACAPETDAALLARECTDKNLNCGDVVVTDRCGASRTVSCGTCDSASGAACGADNLCFASGGKYACGRVAVRNCQEGCVAAQQSCDDTKRCVVTCGGTSCAGKATSCATFSPPFGSSLTCSDVADGGACPPMTKTCTTGSDCGLTNPRQLAVCINLDGGVGTCAYCGAAGSNGLACGAVTDAGSTTCNQTTRSCQ